jgi:hypothetical protein
MSFRSIRSKNTLAVIDSLPNRNRAAPIATLAGLRCGTGAVKNSARRSPFGQTVRAGL